LVQFNYNDGTKLAIHEVSGIIQVNSLLDLKIYETFLAQNEDLVKLLKKCQNLPKRERMRCVNEEGIDVLNKVIEMSQKALEEVDNLIEKSDAAMQKLRESNDFLDSRISNIIENYTTEFNEKQLKLLKARQQLVSLASDTVHFCNKIEISINNWEEEYAAIISTTIFKQLKRFIQNTKTKLADARIEYDDVMGFYQKMVDDLKTWQIQVKTAAKRNPEEYEKIQVELKEKKNNLSSWRIGLVFADIFGCFGFCSTLVYNSKKEANNKLDKKIRENEDMEKKMKKINDAILTVESLSKNNELALKILEHELNLITLWESAANNVENSVNELSELNPEIVQKVVTFKLQFHDSIKELKKAAKKYLNFVNLD